MKKVIYASGFLLSLSLILTSTVQAQPALDLKTDHQTESQTVQPTSQPQKSSSQLQNRNLPTATPEAKQNQLDKSLSTNLESFQNRISKLESQIKKDGRDPQVINWLTGWWQIGFWSGILLLIPWVFVGWQWTHFKFWGFGWPWPWWFWIPLFWFIPWLIIGWQWWLVWWVWWVWVWWLFPWIFWLFWWVIVFKELIISLWHRRKPSSTITDR